jgi:hypothetical protein
LLPVGIRYSRRRSGCSAGQGQGLGLCS